MGGVTCSVGVDVLLSKVAYRRQLGRAIAAHTQGKSSPFTCACYAICVQKSREGENMKNNWIIAGLLAALVFLGAARAAAQSSNPTHCIKKAPTASNQLPATGDQS